MILFELYENNQLIFKGKARDLAFKYNIAESSLYNYYCRGHKISKRYDIKKVIEQPEKKEKPVVVKLSKHEKTIDYIVRHLDLYGNVFVKDDPRQFLKELKEMGYKCKVDEYRVLDSAKRKKRYVTDYVLTVVR